VFARYVDSERFPISAFFQVGIIYFLSLCSIGLLAVDIAFTLRNRYYQDLEELKKT
jgi:cytochrome c biogenesis protein CcdA